MKRDYLMFGAGAVAAALLPVGMIVLEATTSDEPDAKTVATQPASSKSRTTTARSKRTASADRTPATVASPQDRGIADAEFQPDFDVKFDTSTPAAPDLSGISLGGYRIEDVTGAKHDPNVAGDRTDGVSANVVVSTSPLPSGSLLSDARPGHVEFYGGGTESSAASSSQNPIEVSTVGESTVGPVADPALGSDAAAPRVTGTSSAIAVIPASMQTEVESPEVSTVGPDLELSTVGGSSEPSTVGPESATVPEAVTQTAPENVEPLTSQYTGERVPVTLLRPRDNKVQRYDQVVARVQKKGDWQAYLLVRSRQRGAAWWVQPDPIRQGTYFRSRGLFGGDRSPDGSMFVMVIAFVKDITDVPESGVQLTDIPEGVELSEEFIVVLENNAK